MNRNNIRVNDPVLSNLALGYSHPMHVGHELFPRVGVPVPSGKIIKFGKEAFTVVNSSRAPGTVTKRIQIGFATENFSLTSNALDAVVPKEWLRDQRAIPGLNFQRSSINTVLQIEHNNLEFEQASLARNAASYSANNKMTLSGTDKWSDYANSDPIADVKAGKESVRSSTGVEPNKMLIPADVHSILSDHPKLLAKLNFKDGEAHILTVEHYQKIFDIDKVVIGRSILVNPENNGNFEDVWSSDVVLAYVPTVITSHAEMSYGYTYALEEPGQLPHPTVEKFWWDRNIKSWVSGVEYERAPLLTGMDAGFLIQGAK
jgi:hypothetical protein